MTASPGNAFSQRLRTFGPVGLAAIVAVLASSFFVTLLGTVLVLIWAGLSHTPWRELGFIRPKSWIWTVAIGVVFGVALKLVMKAVVMPLLGGPDINPAYHFLAGNSAALPGMLFTVIVGAGFGEELLFRGYMFERLGKLLGSSSWSKGLIVLISSAVFGLAHYSEQGFAEWNRR